jgi:4-hydroxybenzoate polyprenyltransferase
MAGSFLKALDYFFVLRPTLFFPVWTIALVGYTRAESLANQHIDGLSLSLYLFALTAVMGASYLLNQIADIISDRLNNKLYLIANGDIPTIAAWTETALLMFLPVGLCAIWRSDLAILLGLVFLVTGVAYSMRPLMLKDRPVAGLLTNLLGTLLIFSYGWCLHSNVQPAMFKAAIPYLLGVLAVYLYTTIPDMEGDRAADKKTVAVVFGARRIIRAGLLSDSAAILAAVVCHDPMVFLAAGLSLYYYIQTVHRENIADVLRTVKMAMLFLTMVVVYYFPIFLAVVAFLFFFSKWYYRHRFNIIYPSLRT